MGVVYVEGTVTGPTGKQATVNFLVDSGAGAVTAEKSRSGRGRQQAGRAGTCPRPPFDFRTSAVAMAFGRPAWQALR